LSLKTSLKLESYIGLPATSWLLEKNTLTKDPLAATPLTPHPNPAFSYAFGFNGMRDERELML